MNTFSVKDFIRLIFIYQKAAKIAFAVTLITVLIGVFVVPKRYASEAKLLVKPGRESTASVDVIDRPTIVAPNSLRNPLTDEKALLASKPVVNQVAVVLQKHLDEQAAKPGLWAKTKRMTKKAVHAILEPFKNILVAIDLSDRVEPHDIIVTELERNFTSAHGVGSAVIDVKFEWEDPSVAKEILAEWLDAYLKIRLESLSGRDSYAFYEKQLANWQERLNLLSKEQEQLHQDLGAANFEERERKLRERIQIIETQSDSLKLEESAVKGSIASAKSMMPSMPNLLVNERLSKESEAVSNLRIHLNDAIVLREDLLRTYEHSAQPVKDVEQTISSLRSMLAAEPRYVAANETLRASQVKESVTQRVTDKNIRMNEIVATQGRSSTELIELKKLLTTVLGHEVQLNNLKREIRLADENVMLYSNKLEKVRIDQELDLNRISNVTVIEPPTLNSKRVFPKTGKILLASPFAALVIALAVVVLLKLTDQRIFDGWRIQERFGVPFLGALPDKDPESSEHHTIRLVALGKLATRIGALFSEKVRSVGLVPLHENDDCGALCDDLRQALAHQPNNPKIELISSVRTNQESLIQLGKVDKVVLIGISGQTITPVLESEVRFFEGSFPGKLAGIFLHGQKFQIPQKLYRCFA